MPHSVQKLVSRLSFRQLQVFRAVYLHRSYSKAGEQLGLTQPAVSSQIRQLEQALEQPVFEYAGRKLFCTAAGELLANCIDQMFEQLKLLQNELVVMGSQVAGDFYIAAIDTAHCVLPWLLGGFMKQHPQVKVHVRIVQRHEVVKRLSDNVDHLVVMGMAPVDKTLDTLPFLDNELIAVAAPNHPLATQPQVSVKAFLKAGIIVREEISGTRSTLEDWAAKQRVTLEPVLQIDSNDGLKHAAMAGLGVTVVPRLTALSELNSGRLTELPVSGFPLRRSWCLAFLNEKQPNPVTKAFVDYVQDQLLEIEARYRERLKG